MTTDTTEKGELMSASTGDLAELYAAHRLSLVRLAILLAVGQAGLGYLITRGVKRGGLALFVPTGEGELVEAVPTGDVPFGDADPPVVAVLHVDDQRPLHDPHPGRGG